MIRLSFVSDAYIKALNKKKDLDPDATKDKALPIEALGLAMISHGDEFGESSVYGQFVSGVATHDWLHRLMLPCGHCAFSILYLGSSLVNFGRVHVKIASLQEDYASSLQDTYLRQLEDGTATIQEYRAQRKKLDSRR